MNLKLLQPKLLPLLAALILLALTGAQLSAQTIVTGELAGTVTDPSGAPIPNITVTAKSDAYGAVRTATTNQQGEYHLPLLRPGSYTLSAVAPGFAKTQLNATVALGQVSTVGIKLAVGTVSEAVDVMAEAPLLQNENANVTSTLSPTQLANIPIGGSDMVAYAYSAPGVTMSTGAGYGNFTAFGLPATSNMFTVNGADYMDPYLNLNNSGASNLSLGANEVQEAAIITNAYTGQYGRQAGAQVNYITKTGSNAFHGNALWNWNGTKLNANDFFNNSSGTDRPHAVSNQWAWSFGGPIKKDKLFFYVDQEGMRYVLPNSGPIYIPTTNFASYVLANLTANNPSAVPFYTKAFNLYATSTGVSRAVNVGAAEDPALGCGAFVGGGFGPNGLPCARKFQSSVNNLNTEWLVSERADYNLSDKDRIYFRAWTDRGVQATGTDAINSAFNTNSNQPQWSTQLGYTRVISARSVNELSLSGFYYSALFGPPNINAALAVFPTTFAFTDGLFSQLGGGANPSATGLNNYPSGRNVAQWQIIDDYAYTVGAHEFRVGINFRRNDVGDYAYGPGTSGLLSFNSMNDFVNGTLANGSTYAQTFTDIGSEHIGLYSMGIYGQDQWKVKPNLTVTLALRFEKSGNPTCGRNCFDRPNSSFQEISHDVTQPYNSAIQTGLYNAFKSLDYGVIQPRFGLAYTLKNKTVIRAGVGVFADQFEGNLASRFFTNTPNVASFTTGSGTVAAPGTPGSVFAIVAASNAALQSGFKNGATLAQLQASVPGFTLPNLYTQSDNFHIPRYLEWNFEIQQQLSNALTFSVNYVGNHGWNEYNQTPWLNTYSTTGFGGLPTTPLDARFSEINELTNQGHSNYDGLSPTVKWRWRSMVGQANYTWSHNLDTCSNNCLGRFNLATSPSLRYQESPLGVDSSYGNADYDIRHSFTANYVWTIPTRFRNGMLKNSLGGWSIGGTFQAHTGYPYSVINTGLRSTYVKNSSGVATIAMFPDYIGGSASNSCTGPDIACVTTAEFVKTANQKDFGNLRRNAFRGPGYFDADLNINKRFAIGERFGFNVGASMYNVLNHANFDLPVSSLSAGNFGQVISTAAPASSAYGAFQGSAVSGRVVVMKAKFDF